MGLRRPRTGPHDGAPCPDGTVQIAHASARRHVTIAGQVVRILARPARGLPSMAVTISDDSGSITVVWTGRRSIGGITLGRRLIVEGVPQRVGQRLELTNPAYTLLP